MEIGQHGQYTSFLEDKIMQSFLIKLISEDKDDYTFIIDQTEKHRLVISKNCFPLHEWNTGTPELPFKRKTIIEMFD